MKLLKVSSLIFVLLLGYVPEFSGTYLRVFGAKIIKPKVVEMQCDAGPLCRTKYKIHDYDEDLFDISTRPTLGLGVLVPSAKVYCSNDTKNPIEFGTPSRPGESTSESLTKYRLFEIKNNCREVFVEIFAPKEFRRFGMVGGDVVSAEYDDVTKVQRLSDFFLRDFKVICFFTLMFLIALSIFYSNIYSPERVDILDYPRSYIYWLMFLGISSGIVFILIPFTVNPLVLVRVTSFFSILIHASPIVYSIQKNFKYFKFLSFLTKPIKNLKINFFEVAVFLLCLSPIFALVQGPLSFTLGLIGLFICFKSKSFYLVAFSVALLMNAAAFYRIDFAPSFSLTILVVLHSLLYFSFFTLLRGRKLLDVSLWVKASHSKDVHTPESKLKFIKEYLTIVNAKNLSICTICDDSILVESYHFIKGQLTKEDFQLSELPPVYAHLFSAQTELWNVHIDSPLFINIYKGERVSINSKVSGNYFTALPLKRDENTFGFFSVSGYSDSVVENDFEKLLFKNSTIGLIELILRSSNLINGTLEIEKLMAIAKLSSNLNFGTASSIYEFSSLLCNVVSKELQCRSIVYSLDPSTLSLSPVSFSGFNNSEISIYKKWKIYTVNQNEQGPAALAINRQLPVLVPNLKFLESILHKDTVEMMNKNGVTSVCAIPLVRTLVDSDGKKELRPWGLLWLESTAQYFFHPTSRPAFEHFQRLINISADRLFEQIESAMIRKKIDGFVPLRLQNKWLNGDSIDESKKGHLLMFDIRGSTKISKQVGGVLWLNFAGGLVSEMSKIAKKFDFELISWSWDAFHFTKSAESENAIIGSDSIEKISDILEHFLRNKIKESFPSLYDDDQQFYSRVCLVYGDVSTGLLRGITDSWGITGSAMAVVSKLEQAAKLYPGRIFSIASSIDLNSEYWKSINIAIAGSEVEVCVYSSNVNLENVRNFIVTQEVDDANKAA